MNQKSLIWLGMVVGSSIGGFIPLLWDSSLFSFSSIIFTALGGIAGIWLGYQMSH